jgi:hypothetical protein
MNQNLIAAYKMARQEASRLGRLECELINLKYQVEQGNKLPWVAEMSAQYGVPTEDSLALVHAQRLAAQAQVQLLAPLAYRELLESGTAFTIIAHDHLEVKPFEIRRSEELGAFQNAAGAYIRVARYKTLDAAERMIARTITNELSRLEG